MHYLYIFLSAIVLYLLSLVVRWCFPGNRMSKSCPVSVNYHFTRQCNKSCGFCFHTATTTHKEDLLSAQRGLKMLKDAGMKKLNFAGGEPFLYPKFLGSLVGYCKEELHLESVSIVTNGSLVTKSFLSKYGHHIDILAVSCDSFDEKTNIAIGRGAGDQVEKLYQIAEWCREFGIKFKLNTVVCKLNMNEDMNQHISRLQPFRWKCFQVLMVAGENDSDQTLRDVRKFMITDGEFDEFCLRHQRQVSMVPEPNRLMAKSYLILDEYLRFLDREGRKPSASILTVGVQQALSEVFWDEDSFYERGGVYDWKRPSSSKCASNSALDW
ncbi:uncharacterized protein Z518_04933 [Rhinocladiella mackenziei CBS 650.93]|uniref:Radical SAM core domain-containing protein n=1 Tax=Rhinocladiella mackenziei CBS 650.93 TaxID=1442369 RepID=A0A0D2FXA8_9EURO|nr:uncharacterized protein Z518_04933 [Rhinocladiella mackenziei CBS 650.93]KIX06957.1 hypothetical protein Z518_04933 [Rhinocladiella mackenziei CBS 650.93]